MNNDNNAPIIELIGHTHKEGKAQFISDFEQWKLEINNPFPSSKEAWDYQAQVIQMLETKVKAAATIIKRERALLVDLKEFVEEQIVIINELETENERLKASE